MKKTTALIVGACAFSLCLALTGCGSSNPSDEATGTAVSDEPAAAESALEEPAAAASPADADAPAVAAADLASVDVSIEYGDYDGMSVLSKEIQNGERDGQVIEVDGLVSNFARGTSYNIVEPNADGTEAIGTNFVIEGVDDQPEEEAYPADGTHIKIVGKVGIDPDGIYYLIHTLPEYVEVLE